MKRKPNIEPGDELYIPSAWYIDHGEDDRCGGIAVVSKVEKSIYGDHFIHFVGIDSAINSVFILANQDEWEAQYGSDLAHQCPEGQRCPSPQKFDPETFKLVGIKKKVVSN